MLLRVIAVLACAAYGAAVHCANCVAVIQDYHLNSGAVCYHTEEFGTQCSYMNSVQMVFDCDYNDNGESTGGSALCPGKVDIADADDCPPCTN